jgi:uncharacterized membrane protein
MRRSEKVIIAIIALSVLIGLFFYPYLPATVASHWDAQGQVNGYMSKFWGTFLVPFMSIALFLLFLLIPRIDPLRKNIEKFRNYFDWLIVIIMLFLFYVHMLTLLWNLGARFNMSQLMLPALGLLYFYIALMLPKAKRNWFVGIRTPWTLSSDVVWDKTHKLGGKLFLYAAILAFAGLVFPALSIWFILVPVLLAAIITIVYSYFVYKKEKK